MGVVNSSRALRQTSKTINTAVEKAVAKALAAKGDKSNARFDLVKQSTLESILQKGELRVGFEAGYMPFEMTDKKGKLCGV